jgi:hypothetical protein
LLVVPQKRVQKDRIDQQSPYWLLPTPYSLKKSSFSFWFVTVAGDILALS